MKLFKIFGLSKSILPSTEENPANTPERRSLPFLGKVALTTTKLRLCGFIELDGEILEVMSTKGFISKGTPVRIIGQKLGQYLVEPLI